MENASFLMPAFSIPF